MDLTVDLILLLAALLCFIASALNVGSPRVSLLPLGLAFWVLSAIL